MVLKVQKKPCVFSTQPTAVSVIFVLVSPQINELVDCRDVSIGAWFEACIENVTRAPKEQITPTKGKVGRPPKRTNGKLEAEQVPTHGPGQTDSKRNSVVLNSESNGASTSQTDSTAATDGKDREEDVVYHIKYEE